MGLGFGNAAAHQLAISASKDADPKAVKNGLKVAGVSWLVSSTAAAGRNRSRRMGSLACHHQLP